MNWATIYITGKKGFHQEILDILEDTKLKIMPGTTGSDQNVCLLWIDESVTLRELKKAIGSNIVFKYRLHFYNTLEDIQKEEATAQELTEGETSMIREMNLWEESQKYKHSA
jgi:hypothetical protein